MKEQSDIQALTRLTYVIGLVLGGGMGIMVATAFGDCKTTQCSQAQLIILFVGISMVCCGFALGYIVLKSPKTKDIPNGSEYEVDQE